MEQPNKPYGFPAREILIPALKVGALTGTTGLLYGGVAGVLYSARPTIFTIAAGIRWSALGSTFWATRSTILHTYYPRSNPKDRLTASTCAGGITGCVIGGLLRGPRNIIPGTVMFTVFGYVGQTIYDVLDARHSEQVASDAQAAVEGQRNKGKPFWVKLAGMKWSPVTFLSNEEYANTLKETLLKVDAEIALLDEEVERLQGEERSIKERQGQEPPRPKT